MRAQIECPKYVNAATFAAIDNATKQADLNAAAQYLKQPGRLPPTLRVLYLGDRVSLMTGSLRYCSRVAVIV